VLPRTTVPVTGCTCGGCTCGGAAIRVVSVKPQIRITIPATTLLGLDNTPGQLDTYGPVPADVAAQIAADATWQRLITDPVTGILTDHSTTTYQPGKLLRQAVIARDQTCTFPQCDRPACWGDLDHIEPFDHHLDPADQPPGTPGQTRATNLQALCRAHHLAKTHHGWTPVRDPATGTTVWTAPTGHTYTRRATQTGSVGQNGKVRQADRTDRAGQAGHADRAGQADRVGQLGRVSNDITSLTEDTRARLGRVPLNETSITAVPATDGLATDEPTTEQLTTAGSATEESAVQSAATEQRLRCFPDEPPF
jgi:hypothetical protein